MKPTARRSGFVLLMALVLVVLAGAALAGVARRSMVIALEARQSAEELQRRWVATSCTDALLPRAEELLEAVERGEDQKGDERSSPRLRQPTSERRVEVMLAGTRYELVLTDEQSKLNVNRILAGGDLAEVRTKVVAAITDLDAVDPRMASVKLRARTQLSREQGDAAGRLALAGFGQVFEHAEAADLLGMETGTGLAARVTLWGDGLVNLRRAPAVVVKQACTEELGADVVAMLLAKRKADPYRSLDAMLGELDRIDEKQRSKVRACITDTSRCHGLWIVTRNERRSWYSLAVAVDGRRAAEKDTNGPRADVRRFEFTW